MNRMPYADARPPRDTSEPRRDAQRERSRGVVVPFPAPQARRPRRAPRPGESRGQILLFLGVRYEHRAS